MCADELVGPLPLQLLVRRVARRLRLDAGHHIEAVVPGVFCALEVE